MKRFTEKELQKDIVGNEVLELKNKINVLSERIDKLKKIELKEFVKVIEGETITFYVEDGINREITELDKMKRRKEELESEFQKLCSELKKDKEIKQKVIKREEEKKRMTATVKVPSAENTPLLLIPELLHSIEVLEEEKGYEGEHFYISHKSGRIQYSFKGILIDVDTNRSLCRIGDIRDDEAKTIASGNSTNLNELDWYNTYTLIEFKEHFLEMFKFLRYVNYNIDEI